MPHFALKYLRREALPTPFCPGCGCGIVANCFLKAVEELGRSSLEGVDGVRVEVRAGYPRGAAYAAAEHEAL